jgi:hypothetical protein
VRAWEAGGASLFPACLSLVWTCSLSQHLYEVLTPLPLWGSDELPVIHSLNDS